MSSSKRKLEEIARVHVIEDSLLKRCVEQELRFYCTHWLLRSKQFGRIKSY